MDGFSNFRIADRTFRNSQSSLGGSLSFAVVRCMLRCGPPPGNETGIYRLRINSAGRTIFFLDAEIADRYHRASRDVVPRSSLATRGWQMVGDSYPAGGLLWFRQRSRDYG